MPVLQQQDRLAVQRRFDVELKRDVNITLYTQANIPLFIPGRECPTCVQAEELLEEVSSLSPRINLDVVDIYKEPERAAADGVGRIPAFVIDTGGKGKARYFGMPSGFEFGVLIEDVVDAATHGTSLDLETRRQLKDLPEDVHIQVFVTPTCQYCPGLARMAHAMAMESSRVTADVVEIQEFPDLASAYMVRGVPKTVINNKVQFTGAVPEETLIQRVLQAAGVVEEEEEARGEEVSSQTTPVS